MSKALEILKSKRLLELKIQGIVSFPSLDEAISELEMLEEKLNCYKQIEGIKNEEISVLKDNNIKARNLLRQALDFQDMDYKVESKINYALNELEAKEY